VAKKLE